MTSTAEAMQDYASGDAVVLLDGGRRYRCRIIAVESFRTRAGKAQIVQLAPLEGPWPRGTRLVRTDDDVVPAPGRAPRLTDDTIPPLAG